MQPHGRVSEDEYLARERSASFKSELVNGHIIAMAGASLRHNAIVRNVLLGLARRLRGKPCQPYPSDVRMHVPATGLYTYPDISIVCPPIARHPKDTETILNPVVLIEVLSPKTEAFDRGAKFAHYRSIPSLRTYVLVSQDEPRVEWFELTNHWELREAVGDAATVDLLAVGASFPVSEIYVDLPE